MNVAQLIEFLKTQPQDAEVAYCLHSEQCLMEIQEIGVIKACVARPDGWIQNARPGMLQQEYLLFPGN